MALEARFTPAALADLDGIWEYTARVWGEAQAESYLRGLSSMVEVLCSNPEMARVRLEIFPPVRLQRYRSHYIIYRAGELLTIIRIANVQQDWEALIANS